MSLQRRTPGRPRLVAGIGAVIALGGTLLPWWSVGGADGLPVRSGNAFDSTGIIVFVAALATIALLTLPYASERPIVADRWPTHALIATVAWVAFVLRIVDLFLSRAFTFAQPSEAFTRAPGLWLTAVGLLILARAVYDMAGAERRR